MAHYESFLTYTMAMYCPIQIGTKSGYGLVDTGARDTTVHSSAAQTFERIGSRKAMSAMGVQILEQCRVPSVTFLGKPFANLEMGVQDSLHLSGTDGEIEVIARIGQDLLSQFPLHFQFSKNRLGFLTVDEMAEMTVSAELPVNLHLNLPFFQLLIDGVPYHAIFDTGAGMTCVNTSQLAKLQSGLIEDDLQEVIDAMGAKTNIQLWRHDALEIADHTFSNVKLIPLPLEPLEAAMEAKIDFIYGFQSMITRDWIYDAGQSRVLLV